MFNPLEYIGRLKRKIMKNKRSGMGSYSDSDICIEGYAFRLWGKVYFSDGQNGTKHLTYDTVFKAWENKLEELKTDKIELKISKN